jgi:hypothetical protein
MQLSPHLLTIVSFDGVVQSKGAEQTGQVEKETSGHPEHAAQYMNRYIFDAYMPQLRIPPSVNHLTVRDRRLLDHISKFYLPLISNISTKFVLRARGIQE